MQVFRRVGGAAVRLLLFPGIVEALVSGAVGYAVFGMPIMLALAMGFILKVGGWVGQLCAAVHHPTDLLLSDNHLCCHTKSFSALTLWSQAL
jgi:hypothetical protein